LKKNPILQKLFAELGVCQIHWSYAEINFLAGFTSQGVLDKDPTVVLSGARESPISLIMSLMSSVPTITLGHFIFIQLFGFILKVITVTERIRKKSFDKIKIVNFKNDQCHSK
jgi:hypothetical protein